LMDDEPEDMRSMGGDWEVLRPAYR
jgi:hypothetical protein